MKTWLSDSRKSCVLRALRVSTAEASNMRIGEWPSDSRIACEAFLYADIPLDPKPESALSMFLFPAWGLPCSLLARKRVWSSARGRITSSSPSRAWGQVPARSSAPVFGERARGWLPRPLRLDRVCYRVAPNNPDQRAPPLKSHFRILRADMAVCM